MGTITTRVGKSGVPRYTAQIRLKRDGRIAHSEAQTFATATRAREWLRGREFELQQQLATRQPAGPRTRAQSPNAARKHALQHREPDLSESRTLAALIAEFGSGQILLEHCCHYFGLKPREAKRAATRQLLPIPVFRRGSQKSPWMISAHRLAQHIDDKKNDGERSWKSIRAAQSNKS